MSGMRREKIAETIATRSGAQPPRSYTKPLYVLAPTRTPTGGYSTVQRMGRAEEGAGAGLLSRVRLSRVCQTHPRPRVGERHTEIKTGGALALPSAHPTGVYIPRSQANEGYLQQGRPGWGSWIDLEGKQAGAVGCFCPPRLPPRWDTPRSSVWGEPEEGAGVLLSDTALPVSPSGGYLHGPSVWGELKNRSWRGGSSPDTASSSPRAGDTSHVQRMGKPEERSLRRGFTPGYGFPRGIADCPPQGGGEAGGRKEWGDAAY